MTVDAGGLGSCTLTSTALFADKVSHYDKLDITWEYQLGGGLWQLLGTTSNDVYLTLNAVPTGDYVYHSVIYIGSHYGEGATTRDTLVDQVWNYFKTKGVKAVDETKLIPNGRPADPLSYWKHWLQDATHKNQLDVEELLRTRDSTCGAWTGLLKSVFEKQGIDSQSLGAVIVTPSGEYSSIVIRTWLPTNNAPILTGGSIAKIVFATTANQKGFNSTFDGYDLDYSKTELGDEIGRAGQNSPNPLADFANHAFFRYTRQDGTVQGESLGTQQKLADA